MTELLAAIDGNKSYIAAAGLACLCVYHLTQWHLDDAWHAGAQALAVAGLRHAVEKSTQ